MAVGDGSSEPDDDGVSTPQHVEPKPVEDTQPTTPTQSEPGRPEGREEVEAQQEEADEEAQDDDDDEEDDDEEEPRLKYAPLTKNLGGVYRNGDATSAFLVAGDKLIIGTHEGKVHVYALPLLQVITSYRAHSASVSCISISPFPPPLPHHFQTRPPFEVADSVWGCSYRISRSITKPEEQPQNASSAENPSNDIYVATSSIDGHVRVQSLLDPRDVQLRNFGRPVQAVALSPEYKSDKSYLSAGQEGSLIFTVGGQVGKSSNATTTGTAAAASGWLGSIGLGADTGLDKVLHKGEGTVSTIRWSLSGKYVVWVNEEGIKIARSHLRLENSEAGLEWKRISHVSRPNRPGWDEMAVVQKARAEWVDRKSLDPDDDPALRRPSSNGTTRASDTPGVEEVVVGWGDMTWIIRVTPGDGGSISRDAAPAGRAEVISVVRFDDCVIAGVSLYTPTLLLVLAYMEKKKPVPKPGNDSTPRSRSKRHNALKPELRMIDINSKEEVETDALPVGRFESLASSDYHLGVLHPMRLPAQFSQKGYLSQVGSGMATVGSTLVIGTEVVAQGMWDATMYGPRMLGANKLFATESGSTRSGVADREGSPAPQAKSSSYLTGWIPGLGSSIFGNDNEDLKAVATTQGMKIFLMSPYDCIVAVKRNLADRVQWFEQQKQYQQAWELLNEHPEAVASTTDPSEASSPPTPSKASSFAQSASDSMASPARQQAMPSLAEFFADTASITGSPKPGMKSTYSNAEKEKRRIGELWLQQLIDSDKWTEAGETTAKVLNTTTRWQYWVWVFIRAGKYDEITPFIPAMELTPTLPSSVFVAVLFHYVKVDAKRFKQVVDEWPSDLFEVGPVISAIQERLSDDVASDSDDWRFLTESLAKLYLADGRYKEALRCYVRLHDADAAMSLVKDHHLVEAVADDISGFISLRITLEQKKRLSVDEIDDLVAEPLRLLVDETSQGSIQPDDVVEQLNRPDMRIFLFFYFKELWQGVEKTAATQNTHQQRHRFSTANLAADEGKLLVDRYPDLAVEVFADYDRTVLMDFLQTSTLYDFASALKICERSKYIEEEVYLLSKTGSLKKALLLIINELHDVSKAITFAKEQDDEGLWNDLLDYSMSRPTFISGLLAEVGTAINPIVLVKRIPSGIEIEGLKDGLKKMLREYDLQDSISSGAAKILSGEVAINMEILRHGRRRGIKFEVPRSPKKAARIESESHEQTDQPTETHTPKPGHCAICDEAIIGVDSEMLIGFACGHVYHVSCLFKDEGQPPIPSKDSDDDDDEVGFTRSISTKVTHARLLRDRVKMIGGCKVCRTRQKEIENVVQ